MDVSILLPHSYRAFPSPWIFSNTLSTVARNLLRRRSIVPSLSLRSDSSLRAREDALLRERRPNTDASRADFVDLRDVAERTDADAGVGASGPLELVRVLDVLARGGVVPASPTLSDVSGDDWRASSVAVSAEAAGAWPFTTG